MLLRFMSQGKILSFYEDLRPGSENQDRVKAQRYEK
jgi:hypothetical protein